MGIATGKEKYRRKTAPGGPGEAKFNAAKGQAAANWAQGLAEAGQAPGPITTQAYQQGMASAQYKGGNADKWERNWRASISR